jgi:SAM-dependent methyltransferase
MPEVHRHGKKKDRAKSFWEMKAPKYPTAFNNGQIERTRKVISMVRAKGVEIEDKKILDIGCGTGVYTLHLAQEAESVTGLDFSETMAARLRDEIIRYNISNVDIIKASWQEVDITARGFKKSYDITWCAMSMAVRDREDIKKMEDCSKKWCVYIGWGSKRKNELMEEAFRMHGLTYGPPPGVSVVHDILKGAGKAPVIEYFNDTWDWVGTVNEAMENVAGFIGMQGSTADRSRLMGLLNNYEQDGLIHYTTYVEEGVIVWRVDLG